MQPDGIPVPPSGISTPWTPGVMTPGLMTPEPGNNLGDYLSAPLGKKARSRMRTYLAGSKALDSLARLIMSTESFFHPNNAGSWTTDVCVINALVEKAGLSSLCCLCSCPHSSNTLFMSSTNVSRSRLLMCLYLNTLTGWHEEQQPECKTPMV